MISKCMFYFNISVQKMFLLALQLFNCLFPCQVLPVVLPTGQVRVSTVREACWSLTFFPRPFLALGNKQFGKLSVRELRVSNTAAQQFGTVSPIILSILCANPTCSSAIPPTSDVIQTPGFSAFPGLNLCIHQFLAF
jgi:hypothetical protein